MTSDQTSKRRRGHPVMGVPVLVRIPEETIAKLDSIAEHDHVSRAEVVRRLLSKALSAW